MQIAKNGTENAVAALKGRPIQVAAILVAVVLASIRVPQTMPDAYRVGAGIGIVLAALILAMLVLLWRKPARGFVPILTLILSVPLMSVNSSTSGEGANAGADIFVPSTATGLWIASDEVRSYSLALSEAANGDITGTADYTQPNGPAERVTVSGSRLGGGIMLEFKQTAHAPWIMTGQFINENTIRAYLGVGEMLLMPLALRRDRD